MTYTEKVNDLLNRLPTSAALQCMKYVWAVRWPSRRAKGGYKNYSTEKDKDKLVALQRAVRRMENE